MTIATILETKRRTGDGTRADMVLSLHPDASVADAVAMLAEQRIGAAPVLDDSRVVGIFSERDVIHCLQAKGCRTIPDWCPGRYYYRRLYSNIQYQTARSYQNKNIREN